MNSLERCWRVLQQQIPDRVPVDLHNFLPASRILGIPVHRVLQNGEMLAESQLQFWKEFQHDMLLVENGVVAEAGACGCAIEFYDDLPPRVASHVLEDGLDKIVELTIPDPFTTPPMSEVIKAVRILSNELGKKVFIMGRADQGPGALALALRGYERFITDLAVNENPGLIHQVLEYCVEVQTRYARALREAGAHGTAIGGLGISLLSPKLYRDLEFHYEKKVIQSVSRNDYPVALHICGDATKILDDMVATGAPILELDYKTDLKVAKQITQGKSVILGPINPELIWGTVNPSQIKQSVKEAIDICAPGGGFILGPGCALGLDTPYENIHVMIEVAWEYGKYHPDGNLINH